MDGAILKEMGKRYPLVGPMLDITFKKEGINALRVLWSLGKESEAVIFAHEGLVAAIISSGYWSYDRNRIVSAYFPLGKMWHKEIFVDRVARDIESIRFSTMRPLNILMTGRQKIQKESANNIILDCLGNLDAEILSECQLQLAGELEIMNGLPQLIFTLKDPEKFTATIVLDGWSGQIIVNGIPQQRAFSDPEEFHEIVRTFAYDYMDQLTAPM